MVDRLHTAGGGHSPRYATRAVARNAEARRATVIGWAAFAAVYGLALLFVALV